jgi:predicted SAM-dependent methyltransferase
MAISLTLLRRSLTRILDSQSPQAPSDLISTSDPPAPSAGPDTRSAPPVDAPALAELDWRYHTDLGSVRALLARRYIHGTGIEFGALDFPLMVPVDTNVTYADYAGAHLFDITGSLAPPKIVSDLETMHGFETDSQDFIIANHVIEHVEDPLKALRAMSRVLRTNGVIYLAIPDKRFTFDKERAVTPLDHLLRDHAEGPDGSLADHYEEWVRVVDGLTGDAHAQKVSTMLRERANIHFHAWDFAAMLELFAYVERDRSFELDIENATLNSIEVVWILRKK